MKRLAFLSVLLVVLLSSCNTFRVNDRAQHNHLNKVRVNTPVVINEPTAEVIPDAEIAPVDEQAELAVNEFVAESPKAEKQQAEPKKVNNKRIERVLENIGKKTLNPIFKTQANSRDAVDNQGIDPVTLLIWVLVIALILALLSWLIPGLVELFIAILFIVLIVMLIMYLAGSM